MKGNNSPKLRVFIDADVLFAGSASSSEHGASLVILKMAEITLIDAVASQQVIDEVERNLSQKLPSKKKHISHPHKPLPQYCVKPPPN